MTSAAEARSGLVQSSGARALFLALLGLCLLAGCWRAGFLPYDDTEHVLNNPHAVPGVGLVETFRPQPHTTYFPLTELSYQADRCVFESWLPGWLGGYAPGMRFMNYVYHVLAALVLWRLLLRLGLSGGAAFFCAAVFVVHPLWTEAVCWISERKTVLAGFLGFASLWSWEAGRARAWRVPVAVGLYLLAMLAKPSVLGLLPLFFVLEFFPVSRETRPLRPPRPGFSTALALLLLVLISLAAVLGNVHLQSNQIVRPPGGTLFTAMLTDLGILARYLGNVLLPLNLSAAYFFEPIRSLLDPRALLYAALLGACVALSLFLAANRRRAALGWFWFFCALGPSLNLIAIAHYMQDRYLYLSLPGLLLVLVECAAGLGRRFAAMRLASPILATAFVVFLAVQASLRSSLWSSMFDLFEDAVAKQPRAAFAQHGLGAAYGLRWQSETATFLKRKWHTLCLKHWEEALGCPDVVRLGTYSEMALAVGDGCYDLLRDSVKAEHYWRLAAYPPPDVPERTADRVQALVRLSKLRLGQQKPAEAFIFSTEALVLSDEPPTRLLHARMALALAPTLPEQRERILDAARADLRTIPPESPAAPEGRRLAEELNSH